jgi:predicted transcriptional regulator
VSARDSHAKLASDPALVSERAMNFTISLPDDVSEKVQQLAAAKGISVDQCLALAIRRYVLDYGAQAVTEALDQVYAHETSSMDPVLARLPAVSIGREGW